MEQVKATSYPYVLLRKNDGVDLDFFPYLRSFDGDKIMYSLGANHGRSYLIKEVGDRYVVSKGNGLSYTQWQYLNTAEMGADTWGLLLECDAIRDYEMGKEIEAVGITTNRMQYVGKIQHCILFSSGRQIFPILLQYSVKCPYRISDFVFMPKSVVESEVAKWQRLNHEHYSMNYLIAADVLVHNLKILHDNDILYNAFDIQNYTWALELLDFELSCSPRHPYTKEDDRRHVKDLFPRELIFNYQIIKYIANCLGENIDYKAVDDIYAKYGFDLESFRLKPVEDNPD